jgi:hypothetical protein
MSLSMVEVEQNHSSSATHMASSMRSHDRASPLMNWRITLPRLRLVSVLSHAVPGGRSAMKARNTASWSGQ